MKKKVEAILHSNSVNPFLLSVYPEILDEFHNIRTFAVDNKFQKL